MLQIGGIVFLFAMVFGGFLISGGSLGVVVEALPHEMMTIGGASIGALLIGGSRLFAEKNRRRVGQGHLRPEMETGGLSRSSLPPVPAHQDDEVARA